MTGPRAMRVLVVDDEPNLVQDYRYILGGSRASDPAALSDKLERDLFGAGLENGKFPEIDLTTHHQGREAVEAVRAAVEEGRPYALAFVDLYLAPGLDGLQTAEQIRAVDPDVYIVLVSARSDLHPLELSERVPPVDQLFFVKKPFHGVEIQQLTLALGSKWRAEHRRYGSAALGAAGSGAGWTATLERLPAGIVVFDRRDRLLAANEEMSRLFPELADLLVPGTRYEEIQQEIAERLLPEDTLVRVDSWVKDRLDWHARSGGILEQKLRGSRWVLLVEGASPSGETYGLYYDISDIKHREQNRATASHMRQMAQSFAALCERLDPLLQAGEGGPDSATAGRRRGADVALFPGISGPEGPVHFLTSKLTAIAQRQRLAPESIGLNRVVGETVRRMRGELSAGVAAEVIAGAGLWPVLVDKDGFSAALVELLRNAIEAMGSMGRLTVETANIRLNRDFVATRSGLAAGEYVRVSVLDTGPGMSAELAERALNPFFTSKDKSSHLGLGLSVAYGFTSQSGGHIEIDGGDGRGVTVDLYFPRAEEVSAAPLDEKGTRGLAAEGRRSPGTRKRA